LHAASATSSQTSADDWPNLALWQESRQFSKKPKAVQLPSYNENVAQLSYQYIHN